MILLRSKVLRKLTLSTDEKDKNNDKKRKKRSSIILIERETAQDKEKSKEKSSMYCSVCGVRTSKSTWKTALVQSLSNFLAPSCDTM